MRERGILNYFKSPNFSDHPQTFPKFETLFHSAVCIVRRLSFRLSTFLAAAASLKRGSDLISRPQAGYRSENDLARATGEKKRPAKGCFARQREGHRRLSSAVGELGYGS